MLQPGRRKRKRLSKSLQEGVASLKTRNKMIERSRVRKQHESEQRWGYCLYCPAMHMVLAVGRLFYLDVDDRREERDRTILYEDV